ncbi:MAG: hypothetical protein MK214_05155 [Thalassotalea sp.]|nr:hypothetical protein [Thalassotalea sp.]
MVINRPSTDNVGLFAALDAAETRDVVLSGDLLSVTGKSKVAIVTGDKASNDQVTNVNLTVGGSVSGTNYVGAIQGLTGDVSIANSTVSTSVSASGDSIGGLIGEVDATNLSLITSSNFTGSVIGDGYIWALSAMPIMSKLPITTLLAQQQVSTLI